MNDLPILYSFRRCPYAMRARMAIAASGIQCRLREVVLRDKPSEMLAASAKGTVPVIVEPDGQVFEESLDVMNWALGQHDPEFWLAPELRQTEDMLDLITTCDGPFKQALDRYQYPDRYENIDREIERGRGLSFLQQLEKCLDATRFLFGDRPCLADIAIFPFVRQFANTDRNWFDGLNLPRLQSWLDGFLSSDRFHLIMQKYPQWKSGDVEPLFPPDGLGV